MSYMNSTAAFRRQGRIRDAKAEANQQRWIREAPTASCIHIVVLCLQGAATGHEDVDQLGVVIGLWCAPWRPWRNKLQTLSTLLRTSYSSECGEKRRALTAWLCGLNAGCAPQTLRDSHPWDSALVAPALTLSLTLSLSLSLHSHFHFHFQLSLAALAHISTPAARSTSAASTPLSRSCPVTLLPTDVARRRACATSIL